jgi:hypothetical protein
LTADPLFELDGTRDFLVSLNAYSVEEVPEEVPNT